jgi:hypothetical protein
MRMQQIAYITSIKTVCKRMHTLSTWEERGSKLDGKDGLTSLLQLSLLAKVLRWRNQ